MCICQTGQFVSCICSRFSGDPNSFVMGHIFEGKFDGSFFAFGESFHLEPAERYFHFKTPFHSMIFPASSVQFNTSGIQRKMVRVKDLKPVVFRYCQTLCSFENLLLSSYFCSLLMLLPNFKPWRTRYESVNYGIRNYWST